MRILRKYILDGKNSEKDRLVLCILCVSFLTSYRVQKNKKYYAVKVLEDNNNLLILRQEIAFQMRSNCPNIVDVYDTYYFNDKLWVYYMILYLR